jgi:hypothetical protein
MEKLLCRGWLGQQRQDLGGTPCVSRLSLGHLLLPLDRRQAC